MIVCIFSPSLHPTTMSLNQNSLIKDRCVTLETIADMFLLGLNCSCSSRMAMGEMKEKETFGKMDQHLVIWVKMAGGEKSDTPLIYEP